VTTVDHVRLFAAGLRNLHKDVQNWKKMTDQVAKWKLHEVQLWARWKQRF